MLVLSLYSTLLKVVTDLKDELIFFLHRGQYFTYNVAINSKISLDNFEVSH